MNSFGQKGSVCMWGVCEGGMHLEVRVCVSVCVCGREVVVIEGRGGGGGCQIVLSHSQADHFY